MSSNSIKLQGKLPVDNYYEILSYILSHLLCFSWCQAYRLGYIGFVLGL
jgi:hypothetical protein